MDVEIYKFFRKDNVAYYVAHAAPRAVTGIRGDGLSPSEAVAKMAAELRERSDSIKKSANDMLELARQIDEAVEAIDDGALAGVAFEAVGGDGVERAMADVGLCGLPVRIPSAQSIAR